MMGRTHSVHGAIAGLALGAVVGAGPELQLILGAVAGAAAYGPDLDQPRSTASRLLGPITGILSFGVRTSSRAVYAATKGPNDADGAGTHRHLSHTLVAAAGIGLLVGVAVSAFTALAWLYGAAATAGWVAAIVGDACTVSGCPILWPLPIRGETFYELRLLGPASFRTGKVVERLLVLPLSVTALVLLLPGVWQHAVPLLHAAGGHVNSWLPV